MRTGRGLVDGVADVCHSSVVSLYRYSRWDGSQQLPAFDADDGPVCATLVLMPGDRHLLRYHVAVERPRGEE